MSVPEIQPGETGAAYFQRLQNSLKTWTDPTGIVALTQAATITGIALADRNDPVQRAMLKELEAIHRLLDELAKQFPRI